MVPASTGDNDNDNDNDDDSVVQTSSLPVGQG